MYDTSNKRSARMQIAEIGYITLTMAEYGLFHSSFCFSARVVNIWNSLPDYVVDVDTVDIFKSRLDKFWKDQDVMFDCGADLSRTGNRSEFELESD